MGGPHSWSAPDIAALKRAVHAGGRDEALKTFSGFSRAAVLCAMRRYAYAEAPTAPRPIDMADVRARLRDLPLDVLADRLPALLSRTANHHGVPCEA